MIEDFIKPHLLADNATSIQKENVVRYFTDTELQDFKKGLAELHIQAMQRNALVKEIRDIIKLDMTPEELKATVELISKKSKIEGEYGTKLLTKKIAELSEQINKGSIEIHEDVYVFCYYESGKAGVYNSSGHLMYTRAITPDERQTPSIFSINKKIVNE